ncbi:uncharacterized protein LOC143299406 isoform X2 [Babylonia areolata]|uniref:uncharacterized protein LOC143299406 isoform X2 n=1 Tax=Babylonia areolata TaxID=304850 RepID=UPI003FD69985
MSEAVDCVSTSDDVSLPAVPRLPLSSLGDVTDDEALAPTVSGGRTGRETDSSGRRGSVVTGRKVRSFSVADSRDGESERFLRRRKSRAIKRSESLESVVTGGTSRSILKRGSVFDLQGNEVKDAAVAASGSQTDRPRRVSVARRVSFKGQYSEPPSPVDLEKRGRRKTMSLGSSPRDLWSRVDPLLTGQGAGQGTRHTPEQGKGAGRRTEGMMQALRTDLMKASKLRVMDRLAANTNSSRLDVRKEKSCDELMTSGRPREDRPLVKRQSMPSLTRKDSSASSLSGSDDVFVRRKFTVLTSLEKMGVKLPKRNRKHNSNVSTDEYEVLKRAGREQRHGSLTSRTILSQFQPGKKKGDPVSHSPEQPPLDDATRSKLKHIFDAITKDDAAARSARGRLSSGSEISDVTSWDNSDAIRTLPSLQGKQRNSLIDKDLTGTTANVFIARLRRRKTRARAHGTERLTPARAHFSQSQRALSPRQADHQGSVFTKTNTNDTKHGSIPCSSSSRPTDPHHPALPPPRPERGGVAVEGSRGAENPHPPGQGTAARTHVSPITDGPQFGQGTRAGRGAPWWSSRGAEDCDVLPPSPPHPSPSLPSSLPHHHHQHHHHMQGGQGYHVLTTRTQTQRALTKLRTVLGLRRIGASGRTGAGGGGWGRVARGDVSRPDKVALAVASCGAVMLARSRLAERRRLWKKRSSNRFRNLAKFICLLLRAWRVHSLAINAILEYHHTVDVTLDDQSKGSLLFDITEYKADTEARLSTEAIRILKKRPKERTADEVHYVQIALWNYKSLAEYPVHMQKMIAERAWIESYCAKRVIVREGHLPMCFYFVLSGSALVSVMDADKGVAKTVMYYNRGDSFGELAIMNATRRQSTVISKDNMQLLVLTDTDFVEVFMSGGLSNPEDPFLNSLPYLDGWPKEKLAENPKKANYSYFKRGTVLVADSHNNDWIIIVKSGSVNMLKKLKAVDVRKAMTHRTNKDLADKLKELLAEERSGEVSHEDRVAALYAARQEQVEEMGHLARFYALPQINVTTNDTFNEMKRQHDEFTELHGVSTLQARELATTALSHQRQDTSVSRAGTTLSADRQPSAPSQGHRKLSALLKKGPYMAKSKPGDTPSEGAEQTVPMESRKNTTLSALFGADSASPTDHSDVTKPAKLPPPPMFVNVQTLTKGMVFGLTDLFCENQPSVSLVSNGAECVSISKKLFMEHASHAFITRIREDIYPYPSEEALQENLESQVVWDFQRRQVLTHLVQDLAWNRADKNDARLNVAPALGY